MTNKPTNFPWQGRDLNKQLEKSYALINSIGQSIFTQLFKKETVKSIQGGALSNAIISVKDLIDVAGYKTRAGSRFLDLNSPAAQDAEVIQRLREEGASFIGHTNMTELAYSGLGCNPHYGTPETPLYKGCIAGGSTSGGAVSVALGICDIALGSDTGGSLRIPAAFCGVTGFKPSQKTISRQGCLPLSQSLDSIGPIAQTVSECELVWKILSGNTEDQPADDNTHLVIPTNFGLDDLDPQVSESFQRLKEQLMLDKSITIEEKYIPFLDDYKTLPIWHFSAFEATKYYTEKFDFQWEQLDPRVAYRMKKADHLTVNDFTQTLYQRETLISRYKVEENNALLLLPTVAILPPKLNELELDESYNRINALCLRNASLANILDGCSISMPFQHKKHHIGIMLIGANGDDSKLLNTSKQLEAVINSHHSL